jgi:hypothetical protein
MREMTDGEICDMISANGASIVALQERIDELYLKVRNLEYEVRVAKREAREANHR